MRTEQNQHRVDSLKSKKTEQSHFNNDIVWKIKNMTKRLSAEGGNPICLTNMEVNNLNGIFEK